MSVSERAREGGGTLIWRGEAGYENAWASMSWNALQPRRFPDVIVRAASERDVQESVRLARSRGLRVCVRAGGHSWCGSPLRDGGMLIDLSGLRRCSIDPASATATVQPGVTGRELASALAEHGLAAPVGHCGSVALSGFILSGGLGWNPGSWGPACRSLQEIEAVTADGEAVRSSEAENPELLWAARGAGPGLFAVVTSFRLGLHRLPAAITSSRYVFALADVAHVASWADELAAVLPPSVELSVVLTTAGPAMTAVPPRTKVVTVSATAFAGSRDEAVRSLEPLRDCPLAGRSLARQLDEPTSFEALFTSSGALWPERHRTVADTLWSSDDFGALLPELADHINTAPSDRSLVLAVPSPAGSQGAGAPDMAFSVLGRNYLVCYAIWEDPASDEANVRWLRGAMETVEPRGAGHYVAEADLLAHPSRARRSFTPAAWERLRALRAQYDPEGVFHDYLGA